jgi:hypothetical protein
MNEQSKFPVGTKVTTRRDCPGVNGSHDQAYGYIPAGTIGQVVGHTDDGRARIAFDGQIHTFNNLVDMVVEPATTAPQQAQTLLAHDPAALDLPNMSAADLIRIGYTARENEDRVTAQIITAELQSRYHAGTLNAEIDDPKAGRIIVEQRGHIIAMQAEIEGLRLLVADLTARIECANGELLACRASCNELTPRPDWSQAPTWAQWWSFDQNGEAFWYTDRPLLGGDQWIAQGEGYNDDDCYIAPGWQDSLHQRPPAE